MGRFRFLNVLIVFLLLFSSLSSIFSAQGKVVATTNFAPIQLDFTPHDTAVDPEKPVIYMTRQNSKTIVAVDYKSGTMHTLDLPFPGEQLELYDGKLYITQQKMQRSATNFGPYIGAIAVVETSSFELVELFDINAEPYDIAIDKDGYLYVTPGSGQWADMKVYSLHDQKEIPNKNANTRHRSAILYSETTSRVYTITSDVSPRDVTAFEVDNGVINAKYSSPYHGKYPLRPTAKISPDGLQMYNLSGVVFELSTVRNQDMTYDFSFGERYSDYAFSLEEELTFAASPSGGIDVYLYPTDELIYTIQPNIVFEKLHFQDGLVTIYKEGGKTFLQFLENYGPGPPQYEDSFYFQMETDDDFELYDFYDGVRNVPVDTLIGIIFNQTIFLEDETKINLKGPEGSVYLECDDEDGILWVEPDLLKENNNYTLTIQKGAVSGFFDELSDQDLVFNFRTVIPPVQSVSIESDDSNAPAQYRFKAVASGGVEPIYQFSVRENGQWKVVQRYSSNPEFIWSPKQTGTVEFRVHVSSSGQTKDDIVYTFSQTVHDSVLPEMTITPSEVSPTNQDISLTVRATDNFGIKRIKLPNGEFVNGSEVMFSVDKNGTFTFEVEDLGGNIVSQSIEVTNIDKVAPGMTLTPNTNAATNSDVIIEIQASDNREVKRIGLPDGTFRTANTTTYAVSKNGTYRFTVEDIAGNIIEQSMTISNIDKVRPTLTLIPSTTNPTKESIVIAVNATDNVKVRRIKLPNGKYISGATAVYPIDRNGTYTFMVEDSVGNSSTKSIKVENIFRTPPPRPTVNPIWDSHTTIKGKTAPNVTVYAQRGSTRIGSVKSKSNGEFTITIAKQKAGSKIAVYAKDPAGNVSTTREVTVIDKTPPSMPKVNPITTRSKAVTGTAEKGATVHVYHGSTYLNKGLVDSKGNFNIPIKQQRAGRTISVYAVDKAGNKSRIASVRVN
ncbi:Ig-like domain-containing protein [Alkalihalobacterium elongatum]|uniref:Ig-like domain-containing protein n=1 Tax=Alkalihalobacterium elongatum TaxID=2675466 RepID=UPI001C1F9192|nr:Ig-like domain-containing protein [Alkalihalobacterium elongatum]